MLDGCLHVHIHDMENLPTSIYYEFYENGHWVIQKTKNRFSAMPIDQAHEQNNAIVKGSGGAIGLMKNPVAFRKWLLAGPEQGWLIEEFEKQFLEMTIFTMMRGIQHKLILNHKFFLWWKHLKTWEVHFRPI